MFEGKEMTLLAVLHWSKVDLSYFFGHTEMVPILLGISEDYVMN